MLDVLRTLGLLLLLSIPLGVSLWALLDAANRKAWVWALLGRRQVVWMVMIILGIFTLVAGLLISGFYLLRVRPELRAIENGDLGTQR